MKRSIVVVAAAALLAGSEARAEDACGGVKFENGAVTLGKVLPLASPVGDDVAKCLADVAKAASARPQLRGLTVVAKAPDAERVGGKALAAAQAAADKLVEAGLPRAHVSAVAPRTESGEAAGVFLRYAESPADKPAMLVREVSGTVRQGVSDDALRAAEAGQVLPVFSLVRTEKDGAARLLLADASELTLLPGSAARLANAALGSSLKPVVHVDLVEGELWAKPAASAEGAVFEVRGPGFTVSGNGGRWVVAANRVELLDGQATVLGKGEPVTLRGGQAVAIKDGAPQGARPVLAAPQGMSPLTGSFDAAPALTWKPVDGAAGYRVWFGASPEAAVPFAVRDTQKPELSADVEHEGKIWWRVQAVDADGVGGQLSKSFAFERKASSTPAPAPKAEVKPEAAPAPNAAPEANPKAAPEAAPAPNEKAPETNQPATPSEPKPVP